MRFSVRWLKNYLKTDAPLQKIVEGLLHCGLEVEQVIDLGLQSGKLVVGEILNIEPVEGADKIRLTTIQADEPEPLKIICGAKNIEIGQKIPVARFGMVFPDGTELKPRKIMGIEGQGMLCSPKEIGVAEDADGIWILDPSTPVGEPYDALIEISITPNRPDALSIVGIARDLAAKLSTDANGTKAAVAIPDLSVVEEGEKTDSVAKVTVKAKADCPRYTARVVKGAKVGPSPRWMQLVLESAGLRAINNIVDITNFVLLEFGHPLHAFDLKLLNGSQIVVRNAEAGEEIETLDRQKYKLEPSDLLICDAKRPVALAGIMGGGNSEINAETTDILIESAYFRPQTIRKTSRRLDKSTDSSYRFERGTDPKGVTAALNRCAQLIQKYAGGTLCKGIIDVVGDLPRKEQVLVRLPRLNKVLGTALTGRQVTEVLTPLGFEVLRSDREEMLIQVPSFRVDVNIEPDIIEEVARIYGYDKIEQQRLRLPVEAKPRNPLEETRRKLADAAVALGLCQSLNYSFISEGGNAMLGLADARQIRVLNPITQELSVMRRGLLPSLLLNVSHNLNQSVDDIALFELGSTYSFENEEPAENPEPTHQPAIETPWFAAVLCGGGNKSWIEKEKSYDFFDIKGLVEYLLNMLGLQKLVIESVPNLEWLHPGRAARILVKGQPVATFGEVHPTLLRKLGIKKPVQYMELCLAGPVVDGEDSFTFKPIPRFPAVSRDIALVVGRGVRSLDIERSIKRAGKEMLTNVHLFDVYEGEHIEAGKKSLAYALTYRAADRTLKEEEVNERHQAVLQAVEKDHGATLRG